MAKDQDVERLELAQRRMQTGVAMDMSLRGAEPPKHLRVGVNSSLVFHAALVDLLVAKGVITEEEYAAKAADMMEAEAEKYVELLEKMTGKKVTLMPAGMIAAPTGGDA